MSKWPTVDDRNWPEDLPSEYLHAESWGRKEIFTRGLVSAVLGLMRRVDELERKTIEMERREEANVYKAVAMAHMSK